MKKKKNRGSAKGGQFERRVCKQLSMWWTDGERDDVFWRTNASGGRATQRAKTNRVTFGQVGDVQANDPIGQPLIDLCVLELKYGYKTHCIFDWFDKPEKQSHYTSWISKLEQEVERCDAPYWLLIHQRQNKKPILVMPNKLFKRLPVPPENRCRMRLEYASPKTVTIMQLKDFLYYVKPNHIKILAKG